MTQKQDLYRKIALHGEHVKALFDLDKDLDPVKLSKQLFRLENKAHHATTCLCNTNTLNFLYHHQPWDLPQASEAEQDKFFDSIRRSIAKIIGKNNLSKVFINFDPRGYALKIREEYSKDFYYKDWGSYGILAPDFN